MSQCVTTPLTGWAIFLGKGVEGVGVDYSKSLFYCAQELKTVTGQDIPRPSVVRGMAQGIMFDLLEILVATFPETQMDATEAYDCLVFQSVLRLANGFFADDDRDFSRNLVSSLWAEKNLEMELPDLTDSQWIRVLSCGLCFLIFDKMVKAYKAQEIDRLLVHAISLFGELDYIMRSQAAANKVTKRHKKSSHPNKRKAFQELDKMEGSGRLTTLDEAATLLIKTIPVEFSTARKYATEWRKTKK